MATYDERSGANDRGLVASGTNHTTVRDQATANAATESTGDDLASDEKFGADFYLRRSALEFPILPAVITTVSSGQITLKLGSTTGDTDNYSVNIFFFDRVSTPNTAFDLNDYDEARGIAACDTPKDITGLTGDQVFTLNAAALDYIKSKAGGYPTFVVRVSGDYGGSAPTAANLLNGFRGHDGTPGNRPRLEFTYTSDLSKFFAFFGFGR